MGAVVWPMGSPYLITSAALGISCRANLWPMAMVDKSLILSVRPWVSTETVLPAFKGTMAVATLSFSLMTITLDFPAILNLLCNIKIRNRLFPLTHVAVKHSLYRGSGAQGGGGGRLGP